MNKLWLGSFFSLFLLLSSGCEQDYLTINPFETEGTTIGYQKTQANDSLNTVIVSMRCAYNKAENISKVIDLIGSIKEEKPETELIVFGETVLSWYYVKEDPKGYMQAVAEVIPGPGTEAIGKACKQNKVYAAFGLAEVSNDTLYNTLVLIDPSGEIVAKHRKNTLTPEDQASGFVAEKNDQVIYIKDFKIGLMICADVNGAWLTTQYNLQKVDLIISVFASEISSPNFNPISRRLNAWQIFANRNGNENGYDYSGLIYISDPLGNLVVEGVGKEQYLFYTIKK